MSIQWFWIIWINHNMKMNFFALHLPKTSIRLCSSSTPNDRVLPGETSMKSCVLNSKKIFSSIEFIYLLYLSSSLVKKSDDRLKVTDKIRMAKIFRCLLIDWFYPPPYEQLFDWEIIWTIWSTDSRWALFPRAWSTYASEWYIRNPTLRKHNEKWTHSNKHLPIIMVCQ